MTSSNTSRTSQVPEYEYDLGVQRAELLCHLLPNEPESLLDVGCSYGYTLRRLSELLPGTRLAGLDIEQSKLDLAKQFNGEMFELYNYPAHDTPFEDNEFEWVYCSHTLEHCNSVPNTILEFKRITRVGMCVVVPLEGEHKFHELRRQEEEKGNSGSHLHQFHTKDPFVWMDFFRVGDLLPIYYKFTDRSDMILILLKQSNVGIAYGGFWKDGYEDSSANPT